MSKDKIFCLTYTSSASGLYAADDYQNIAFHARDFNKAHDITGLLLVYNHSVMQFLEGPKDHVLDLYNRIEVDPRHKSPVVLSRVEREDRDFPGWAMGYQEIVKADDPDHLFQLNLKTMNIKTPSICSETTKTLLKQFMRASGLVRI